MAMVAGRLEKMLSWSWSTSRAAAAFEMATMWRKPMRRCKTPPYCMASLAKPLCVSWSMMFMLPMMGRPFGPGGYGAVFPRIRDSKPHSSNVATGIINNCGSKSMVWNFGYKILSGIVLFMIEKERGKGVV